MLIHSFPVNSLVTGVITSFDAHRVNLTLNGNVRAYVREGEIAWDEPARRIWQNKAKVGDSMRAKVIRHDRQGRPELSLRVMSRDPWDTITTKYRVGGVVQGVVRGITADALFVALEPGVEGILRLDDLGFMRHTDVRAAFWPGDSLYVMVQTLVPDERRLSLTLDGVRARRWEEQQLNVREMRRVRATRQEVAARDDLDALVWADLGAYYHFLVVDNEPQEREYICNCLHAAAQRVHCAQSIAEAESELQRHTHQFADEHMIVIVDKQMPDGNGDEAIPGLREAFLGTQFILMSQVLSADEIETWRQAGVPAIYKPLTPQTLAKAVQQLDEGVQQSAKPRLPNPTMTLVQFSFDPKARLTNWLNRTRERTRAQTAAIFEVNLTGAELGRVELLTQVHTPHVALRQDKVAETIYSPVRDVAISQQIFVCEDVDVSFRNLGYLRNLGPFGACVGVPIQTATTAKYALFMFWNEPLKQNVTQRDMLLDTINIAADAAGGLIEQNMLLEKMIEKQRMIAAGELATAVTHDLYTQVGALKRTPEDLRTGLSRLEDNLQHAPDKVTPELKFLRRKVEEMKSATEKAAQTSDLFKQLSLQTSMQYLLIEKIIDDAIALTKMKVESEYKNISVEFVDSGMVIANSDQMRLMQVLQNLLLNAVQQIAQMQPPDKGRVIVRITTATSVLSNTKQDVVQIRIEDNGPGIHTAQYESIFDLGVTNRANHGGSGIGLYFTRTLVHQLGGRVLVENSAIGWGSCFLIELPCKY